MEVFDFYSHQMMQDLCFAGIVSVLFCTKFGVYDAGEMLEWDSNCPPSGMETRVSSSSQMC